MFPTLFLLRPEIVHLFSCVTKRKLVYVIVMQQETLFDMNNNLKTKEQEHSTRYDLLKSEDALHPSVQLAKETYDNVETSTKKDRRAMDSFMVKNLTNFVKSVLLRRHGLANSIVNVEKNKSTSLKIMDLGCGHGPDIYKLIPINPECVVFVDISEKCLQEAELRWKKNRYPFEATFLRANFCQSQVFEGLDVHLSKHDAKEHKHGEKRTATAGKQLKISKDGIVDVISCQSALQYAFYNMDAAECFLQNISSALPRGGIFMGMFPDGGKICAKLSCGDGVYIGKHYSIYSSFFQNPNATPASAIPYTFSMGDNVRCREYTVIPEDLIIMARKCGLHLVHRENMSDFALSEIKNKKNQNLVSRMNIVADDIADEDVDFLETSLVFVFIKL